jgi:hypothetical protein
MAPMLFDQPIYVKRTNFIQEIACVEDALDFLEEWPLEERNLVYEVTLKALRDTMTRNFPISSSYETFKRFAKKSGLLCPIENVPAFANRSFHRSIGRS